MGLQDQEKIKEGCETGFGGDTEPCQSPWKSRKPSLGKTMAKPRIFRLWFVTLAEKEPIERKSYYDDRPFIVLAETNEKLQGKD